ncbi:BTAD domain-containing putative transcriptional regulator [Actinosynnema sp. NPDC059797]
MELRLLGEVALVVDGRHVDLGPARQRTVWAALALEVNRVVPVERLVERVWGEEPPLRARPTLLTYLSRLRQVLAGAEGVELVRRSGGYLLAADESAVDLHRFRRLCARARACPDGARAARWWTEALALWRGEVLAGLTGEWAEAERELLRQERLAAEHDLVDARLRAGEGGTLVDELAARVAGNPLDERVAGQYLLALHRAGRSADALAHYRHVRERLLDELGADPGPALVELHGRILAADPALTAPPVAPPVARSGDVAERAVVPRQLPAVPWLFVGRDDELRRLDDELARAAADGSTMITAVAGAGGIGKTWLALHWANRHLDRFPDGQLFVDLRGFAPDGRPMDPDVAVRGFLDALGVEPHRLPREPHAQAALYRSLVADRRVLVVLDNAAGAAQVTPLLPGGAACAVVVTSRELLTGLNTGHAAAHVALDALSDPEARALLVNRLGDAEPAAIEELIALCGGYPLALGIVAGHARTRPRLPLTALVDELRDLGLGALDDNDPAASLPAVLSWSHRALTPEQRTAFALLGVAPGPDIGLAAAADLIGLPPHRAGVVLRALEQASLISRDARGRYRMHDLIRQYAADTARDLPAPAREAALRRVVDSYLHTALAADLRLSPQRKLIDVAPPVPGCHPEPVADHSAAMAWFEREHACVLAAQRAAADRRWDDVVWHLAWALNTFHHRTARLHDEAAAWQLGLVAVERAGGPADVVLGRRLLSRVLARLHRHDEALELLRRALVTAEEHDDLTGQAYLHGTLSQVLENVDEESALDHATRALELFRTLGDPVPQAQALANIGWLNARLGRHAEAVRHCLTALELHRRHGHRQGEAHTLDSLGYTAHQGGDHEGSTGYYRQALALWRELGDAYNEAESLDGIGHPLAALGRADEARETWRAALELYRRQGRDTEVERLRAHLDGLGLDEFDHGEPGGRRDPVTGRGPVGVPGGRR